MDYAADSIANPRSSRDWTSRAFSSAMCIHIDAWVAQAQLDIRGLVDAEWVLLKNNLLSRLIRKPDLHFVNATIGDIEYHTNRKLDKAQITRLSTCNYIAEMHNIIIFGASGAGKTYLTCRFYPVLRFFISFLVYHPRFIASTIFSLSSLFTHHPHGI